MTLKRDKKIKCYTCKYWWEFASAEGLFIECRIPRKSQPGMSSSWWVSQKFDKWGHRKYLKKCSYYENKGEVKG